MFQKLLNKAVDEAVPGASKTAVPPALGEIGPISYTRFEAPAAVDIEARTEKLLGLLEKYSMGMENPAMTLKELEPVIRETKQEAEDIAGSLDGSESEELKNIAGESAALANSEYIKFMRGDYI